jgi:serine/threonine protein kinase
MLTPDYASPEQVRGLPVTTASDVYSLGAMLFELLTGKPAHRLTTYTPEEVARVVCDTDVGRPSDKAAPEVRREVGGDLDNIVLMAMRKEPERRYASASELRQDIERRIGARQRAGRLRDRPARGPRGHQRAGTRRKPSAGSGATG